MSTWLHSHSGGYLCMNSLCALIAAWLDVSQISLRTQGAPWLLISEPVHSKRSKLTQIETSEDALLLCNLDITYLATCPQWEDKPKMYFTTLLHQYQQHAEITSQSCPGVFVKISGRQLGMEPKTACKVETEEEFNIWTHLLARTGRA